jgi:hypothetical protein
MRNFALKFPYILSIAVGVVSGIYIFKPTFEEIAQKYACQV